VAKNFYAVKNGHVPGIYETWDECEQQVAGYSGASYKGFEFRKEAEAFLGIISTADANPSESESVETQHFEAVAYVDGSYDESIKAFAYGVVIFHDEIQEHFSGKMNDPDLAKMRNVAGEIKAAEKAMQFCVDHHIKSIDIYYDYEGIAKWCTGEWKAKQPGTIAYKTFYEGIKADLVVNFIKVASHSGDKYNDLADQLAKSALGLGEQPDITQGMNNMTANNINKDDFEAILDLLKEDIPDLCVEKYEDPYGQGYLLTTYTPKKQKLKIVHYDTKKKIWLQGKKEELFNQLSMCIVELLETDEVPRFLNSVNQLHVDKDIVETKYHELLPNASQHVPDKISKTLHQAVYNLNIGEAPYDATFIAEPALRVLEGILKIALIDNDLPLREDGKGPYDSFFVFEKVQKNAFKLDPLYIKSHHSLELQDYLSRLYTHFYQHRHILFHWDDPTEKVDTTTLIETPNEAHTLIIDTLKIIDDYYTL
jgi:ribonuclease HI